MPPHPRRSLATLIGFGHFDAHLKRMRALYRERRDAAMHLFARHLDVELGPADAGFRVVAFLEKNDRDVARPRNGLVLGYMDLTPSALTQGVKSLSRLI